MSRVSFAALLEKSLLGFCGFRIFFESITYIKVIRGICQVINRNQMKINERGEIGFNKFHLLPVQAAVHDSLESQGSES